MTNDQQYDNQTNEPTTDASAHFAGRNTVMIATITKTPVIPIRSPLSVSSPIHNDTHTWLVDSAASSHISGNLLLFSDIHEIPPVTIQTASGESFTADQSGSIHIKVMSDPSYNLVDVHITLTNVIYAPKLHANLLSVRRMTDANVNMLFSKNQSALSLNGRILARGSKVDNLFTYTALPMLRDATEFAHHSPDPIKMILLTAPNHFPNVSTNLPPIRHVTPTTMAPTKPEHEDVEEEKRVEDRGEEKEGTSGTEEQADEDTIQKEGYTERKEIMQEEHMVNDEEDNENKERNVPLTSTRNEGARQRQATDIEFRIFICICLLLTSYEYEKSCRTTQTQNIDEITSYKHEESLHENSLSGGADTNNERDVHSPLPRRHNKPDTESEQHNESKLHGRTCTMVEHELLPHAHIESKAYHDPFSIHEIALPNSQSSPLYLDKRTRSLNAVSIRATIPPNNAINHEFSTLSGVIPLRDKTSRLSEIFKPPDSNVQRSTSRFKGRILRTGCTRVVSHEPNAGYSKYSFRWASMFASLQARSLPCLKGHVAKLTHHWSTFRFAHSHPITLSVMTTGIWNPRMYARR